MSQPPFYYGQPGDLVPSSEERTWAWISHAGTILAVGISGLLGFVCPLVIMLTKGTESPYVRRNAVESLNFQISLYIYALVCFVLVFVLIGFFLLLALAVFALVAIILATVKAANGEEFRYPLCIRLVR
jgi:uncharacterized Tic20 family protein